MPFRALPPGLAALFMGSQVSRGVRRAAERRLEAEERKHARLIKRQELRESRAFRARESERGRKFGGQMEEARRGWAMEQEARGMEARRTEAETQFGRQQQLGEEAFGRKQQFAKETFQREAPERWGRYDIAGAREDLLRAQAGAVRGEEGRRPEVGADLSGVGSMFGLRPEAVQGRSFDEVMKIIDAIIKMRSIGAKAGGAKGASGLADLFKAAGIEMPAGMGAPQAGAPRAQEEMIPVGRLPGGF